MDQWHGSSFRQEGSQCHWQLIVRISLAIASMHDIAARKAIDHVINTLLTPLSWSDLYTACHVALFDKFLIESGKVTSCPALPPVEVQRRVH